MKKVILVAALTIVGGIGCHAARKHADKPAADPERASDGGGRPARDGSGTSTEGGAGDGPAAPGAALDGPGMIDTAGAADADHEPRDAPAAPVCGNGTIESGEECDPQGSCPTSCSNQGCTTFVLQGSASDCTARCQQMGSQTACSAGDGCCPASCNAINDADCAIKCDNGVKEGQETCDPLSTCPTACPPQGCQMRQLVNPGSCMAACTNDRQQTTCMSGDGCCPASCNNTSDGDCQPRCGNSVVEIGESCDPVSQCNSRRDACTSNRETIRVRSGDPASCTFRCMEMPRACGPDDDQCPSGCPAGQDPDCRRPNGESCGSGAECVSGNCVGGICCNTACNDGCRSCRVSGRVGTCSAPSSTETCSDGKDNNCDGSIDENCCGGPNQPCCATGDNVGCVAGYRCFGAEPRCQECGDENELCCENRQCKGSALGCWYQAGSRNDRCMVCGRQGAPFCTGRTCNVDLACTDLDPDPPLCM